MRHSSSLTDVSQVIKVDIDTARSLVKRYSLRGLPYIAIFKGGEKIDGVEGVVKLDKINDLLKKAL